MNWYWGDILATCFRLTGFRLCKCPLSLGALTYGIRHNGIHNYIRDKDSERNCSNCAEPNVLLQNLLLSHLQPITLPVNAETTCLYLQYHKNLHVRGRCIVLFSTILKVYRLTDWVKSCKLMKPLSQFHDWFEYEIHRRTKRCSNVAIATFLFSFRPVSVDWLRKQRSSNRQQCTLFSFIFLAQNR